MATTKKSPPKKGRGRPGEGKADWKPISYRMPLDLRESVKGAFHRAAGQPGETVSFTVSVEMDKPTSINEFVAAILRAAVEAV